MATVMGNVTLVRQLLECGTSTEDRNVDSQHAFYLQVSLWQVWIEEVLKRKATVVFAPLRI